MQGSHRAPALTVDSGCVAVDRPDTLAAVASPSRSQPMPLHVSADVTVPGDKSITHRALMVACAATGCSRLRGLLGGEDCRSTAAVLRALGCEVPELPGDGSEIRVRSGGLVDWQTPEAALDCGNSG